MKVHVTPWTYGETGSVPASCSTGKLAPPLEEGWAEDSSTSLANSSVSIFTSSFVGLVSGVSFDAMVERIENLEKPKWQRQEQPTTMWIVVMSLNSNGGKSVISSTRSIRTLTEYNRVSRWLSYLNFEVVDWDTCLSRALKPQLSVLFSFTQLSSVTDRKRKRISKLYALARLRADPFILCR